MQSTIGVLGEIRIERGTALHTGNVVIDDFLQRGETTIVHVRRGEGDIAQTRRGELAQIRLPPRDFGAAQICELRIETVVGECLTLEQRAAVAVEAVRAKLIAARI